MSIEILARDLARAVDPVALTDAIGMVPDPWQEKMLRSSSNRILLNIHRQGGKSTTAAFLGVHVALYEPGSLVLIVAPTQRQSGELFRKCLAFYRALGRPQAPTSENLLSLELENRSRIVSLPGNAGNIRSFSNVRRLIIDEAAQVADDTYETVRPMLAVSGGDLIAMSTPFGKRGWWYHAYTDRAQRWERYEVKASECSRISPEFLAEERRDLGDWFFKQEYECEFVDAESQIFTTDHVERALNPGMSFGGALA